MVQEDSINNKVIMIAGATGVGKTSLSLKLANLFNCEIISVDSMQIYKDLNIGTGKILESQMNNIPHHMIDIISHKDSFSVFDYVEKAKSAMQDIWSRGKTPLLVGGTGLYFNALINGHNFSDSNKNEEIRNKYTEILKEFGEIHLHRLLKEVDSLSAEKIFPNDTKRVIRALEIFETTGKPKSMQAKTFKPDFKYFFMVLDLERKKLYDKINSRVDGMIKEGLLKEIKTLAPKASYQSMQAIGYKEVLSHFNGEIDFATCVNLIKQNSRHYAKRQLTYFRWMDCEKLWLDASREEDIINAITMFLT